MNSDKKKIAMSGAGGFIGSYLSQYFTAAGWQVIPLSRSIFEEKAIVQLKNTLSTCTVVINLAGAPILHLWTESYKKKIKESRIHTTHSLVKAINMLENKPDVFISASAVGFYPPNGNYDESYTDENNTFLSEVCRDWEREAQQVSRDVRLAITRFGIVLGKEGGAFKQMTRFSKKGVATILGPGTQAFPWISLEDLAGAMNFIIENEQEKGLYNFTTPEAISYRGFIKQVQQKNKSLIRITFPPFLLKMVLGEATSFITGTSYVYPTHLIEGKFVYKYPTISDFLNSF